MTDKVNRHRGYVSASVLALVFGFSCSVSQAQNIFGEPNYGLVSLTAGFAPDPKVTAVSAGGSTRFDSCTGYYSANPDLNLNYQGGEYDLSIFAKSGVDTTLAINQPDGSWLCSDDSEFLSSGNPGVLIDNPDSGIYNIWLGLFTQTEQIEPSSLVISEQSSASWDSLSLSADIVSPNEPDISAAPNFGTVTLASGFVPDPNSREILAGGSTSSSQCTGFYSSAPHLNVNYTAGEYNLGILSRSSGDTTILVNDALGNWHCNDDSVSMGGSNAAVAISNPPSGLYNIWVGTFSSDQALELQANLMLTETDESYWATLGLEEPAEEVVDEVTAEVIEDVIEETVDTSTEVNESAVQFGRKNI